MTARDRLCEMNSPTESSPQKPAPEAARRRRRQIANVAASVVLCGGAVVFSGYAALLTVFLAMATGTCAPCECNTGVVNWTILSGLAGIVLILIAMFTLVVRSLIRRRCAVWWPLLAAVLIAALWTLCMVIVSAATGS